jgi:O-antigen/teichoic acid export membrane protein
VARSIFWLAWSRGVGQLLSFATTVLVARILVPADYGVMALASMFIGTAGVLAEMGLSGAIVQFRDLDKRELDTCFWITVTLAAIIYAVLALGASVIADWFAAARLADVLPVLGLGLPLNACTVVSASLLRKQLALDQVSQAEIIGAVVTLPVMLSCALAGFGVWTLVIGSLVSWLARGAVILAFAPWLPGLHIGGKRAKEILHFSLTTFGVNILWAFREQADVAVIGKIAGQDTVGLYSMAKDLAMLPTAKISSVVFALSSPMMAELQTDVATMRRAFFRAVRLTAAIAWPASAGVALVADDMVAVLLGPKWRPAVTVLRLLCLYAAVRGVDVLLPPVLVARRRQRFLFWSFLWLFLAVPIAAALGTLWCGAPGAVVVLTPVYCGLITIMAREALAELEARPSELWSKTWPILAATAAMAAVILLLRETVFAGPTNSALVELMLLSMSGALTYVGALFVLGRTVIGEGAEVVGWMLRRHRLD